MERVEDGHRAMEEAVKEAMKDAKNAMANVDNRPFGMQQQVININNNNSVALACTIL